MDSARDPFNLANYGIDLGEILRRREEDRAAYVAELMPSASVTGGGVGGTGGSGAGRFAQVPVPYVPGVSMPEENPGFLRRAGRMVTGILSPLALPQDLLFAALAGALDRDRTIMDYMADMDWAHYGFWNQAPYRSVSGADLLRMAGVKNEKAQQWFGLAADFLVDPLLAGTAVRALGKVANLPDLARVANILDTVAEAPMILGGLPTTRVAAAARRVPLFRNIEDAVVNRFVRGVVMPALAPVLERDFAWRGEHFNLAGLFTVDGGRMPGARDVVARAGALAEEATENTLVRLIQADAAAGGTWHRGVIDKWRQAMSVMYDIPTTEIEKLAPEVQRALMTNVAMGLDNVGYLTLREMGVGTGLLHAGGVAAGSSDRILDAQRAVTEIARTARATTPTRALARETAERVAYYDDLRNTVMRVATDYGNDAQRAGSIFDTIMGKLSGAAAMEGYLASGYGPLRDRFVATMADRLATLGRANRKIATQVARAGGEAQVVTNAWQDLIRAGVRGQAAELLDQPVRWAGRGYLPQAQHFTYRQMFGDFANVPGLDLGVWLDKLPRGHLRRAFGMFQDQGSWNRMLGELKDGRLQSARTLNERAVYQGVANAGYGAEMDIVKKYLDDIAPRAMGGRPTGLFVRQEEVLEMLTRQGVDPLRAEAVWREIAAHADPFINGPGGLAERMFQYGAREIGNVPQMMPGAGPSAVLRSARQNLGQDEVETLVELFQPFLSTLETTRAAGASIRRTEAITGLTKLAEARGLMVDLASPAAQSVPKWWKILPRDMADALPTIANKVVHPMVYREMMNLVRVPKAGFMAGVDRVRSMITAGYLANPATTTANVAGGFWTAAQYGLNPATLLQNMLEVYRDWRQLGNDLPELAHMRDIVQNTMSLTDIVRYGDDIVANAAIGLRGGIEGIGRAMRTGTERYMRFLQRPLGTRGSGVLGLGAFEATEALFRMGAFRMVMKKTSGALDEARRAARFIVFDYAAQPGIVKMARDTGVFLFPAFPYFMAARTVRGARNMPGVVAAVERVPELISKMVVPDEDQRMAMLTGMEDWQLNDRYIPIRRKENGDVSTISFNQLIPTNTVTGASFTDSLRSFGLIGPLYDLITAIVGGGQEDRGAGTFTSPYGRRTLPQGVTGWDQPGQMLEGLLTFAYNSFAPAILRKSVRPPEDYAREWEGLIPNLIDGALPVAPEWAGTGRTLNEIASGRAAQDAFDAAISFTLRSTRTVATQGVVADGPRILDRATTQLERDLARIDQRMALLNTQGRTEELERLATSRQRIVQRFMDRWGDYITELRTMAGYGRFTPGFR